MVGGASGSGLCSAAAPPITPVFKHASIMKLAPIISLLLAFALCSSCKNYQAQYEEEQQRQRLLDEQLSTLEEEERLIKGEYADAMETLNAIDQTLTEMSTRNEEMAKLLKEQKAVAGTSKEQEVLLKIKALKDANTADSENVERLRKKAKNLKVENEQLKKMSERLEARYAEVQEEVNQAQTTIASMQLSLNRLEEEVASTESALSSAYADLKVKTTRLERSNIELETTLTDLQRKNDFISNDASAYVVCGDRATLRKNKILRLLSSKRLTTDYRIQVNQYGTPVDYFNNNTIECGDKTVQYVLPERDPNSYSINAGTVTVKDRDAFWNTAKTVVLVTQ